MYYNSWLIVAIFYITLEIQLCSTTIQHNIYNKDTTRVSDGDYDTMFTDAGTTKSRMRCIVMCITSDSNTYYDVNTGQCSCQSSCTAGTYTPVNTGSNYVETYDTGEMSRSRSTFVVNILIGIYRQCFQ